MLTNVAEDAADNRSGQLLSRKPRTAASVLNHAASAAKQTSSSSSSAPHPDLFEGNCEL